jgi:hypothetical protein
MRGDPDAARKLLAEGGYGGEKVVILQPTDVPPYGDYAAITADLLRRIGMNVELVATDWGTVTQRRANRGPVEQGGWSIFVVGVNGPALLNPAFNFLVRGQGERGYFGWYRNDEVERLTADWLQADTLTCRWASSPCGPPIAATCGACCTGRPCCRGMSRGCEARAGRAWTDCRRHCARSVIRSGTDFTIRMGRAFA